MGDLGWKIGIRQDNIINIRWNNKAGIEQDNKGMGDPR